MTQTRMIRDSGEDRPALDALNRTIGDLETRLNAIMESRRSRTEAPPATPRPEDAAGRTPPRRYARPAERAARERSYPDPGSARVECELRDIARTLKELRAAIHDDFTASLRDELAGLHDMLAHLDRQTDTTEIDVETQSELARISDGIDWLVTNASSQDNNQLLTEFEHLRTLLGSLADTKSIKRLETSVERVDEKLAAFDPARLDDELITLAEGLEDIRQCLARQDNTQGFRDIETRLTAFARVMETMIAQSPAAAKRMDSQIAGLESRIGDVDRSLERIAHQQSEAASDPVIARMDGKLGDLSNALSAIDRQIQAQNACQSELVNQLQTMARKLEEHRQPNGYPQIEARLDRLAGMVENAGSGVDAPTFSNAMAALSRQIGQVDLDGVEQRIVGEINRNQRESNSHALNKAVADLSTRVGQIDVAGTESRLGSKLDQVASQKSIEALERKLDARLERLTAISADHRDEVLHRKIDSLDLPNLEGRLTARILALDPEGSETRLGMKIDNLASSETDPALLRQFADIATRLEKTLKDDSGQSFRKIEGQIGELTELIRRSDPSFPVQTLEKHLGDRIDALAKSNDDHIIEAARYAAEEALKGAKATEGKASDSEHEILTTLIQDLKALQEANRSAETAERDELKAIVSKIADRLDHFAPAALSSQNAAPSERQTETRPTNNDGMNRSPPSPNPAVTEEPEDAPVPGEASNAATQNADEMADVLSVLNRVRARQMGEKAPATSTGPDARESKKRSDHGSPAGARNQYAMNRAPQGELIAAARRAARSAATHAEDTTPEKKNDNGDDGGNSGKPPSRRPVYLAASAILLAVLAYPLISQTGDASKPRSPEDNDINTPGTAAPALAKTHVITREQVSRPTSRTESAAPPVSARETNTVATITLNKTNGTADAFRMTDTDRSIITGSITPAPESDPFEAAASKALARRTAADEAENAAVETDFQPSEPVKDHEVLDMLSDTASKTAREHTNADTSQAIKTADPAGEAASASVDTAAISLPKGLKPASLAAAANQGNPAALYEIGVRFEDGAGLPKDMAKAARWFDRAAQKGSAPAAFNLGRLYETGKGVPQDSVKAISFYRQAAEAGNIRAMHNLAVLLANGADGGKPDVDAAARWFENAANHGVSDSQFNLAILYARGSGVKADLVQSYKWFTIAAKAGDKEAAKRRDEVAEALSSEELTLGKTIASEWKVEAPRSTANTVIIPSAWQIAETKPSHPIDKQAIVRDLQTRLNNQGYDAGPADGVLGKRTDAAIRAFQKANGLETDGKITPDLVKTLLAHSQA